MGDCTCGTHAIVMDAVPDPGCPIHGDQGTNAWSTCPECLRIYRHVVGHRCAPDPMESKG